MKMIIYWETNETSVKSCDDMESIREAIEKKEKWVYLCDAGGYINLDLVLGIRYED